MTATLKTSRLILLYDGTCGLCNRSVQFLIRHDEKSRILFAALQSRFGESVRQRHTELRTVDSAVLVEQFSEGEQVFTKSDAVLRLVRYLGGVWRLAVVVYIIPRAVRDYVYDQLARRRYKWFGKYDECLLPQPDVRSRFLDRDEFGDAGKSSTSVTDQR